MSKKSSQSDSKVREMLTPEEISSYRQIIGRLAKGRINQGIPNDHPMHAAVLIQAMFENARSDVRIFTGKLAPAIYDQPELIACAKRFLENPGARLRILIQSPLSATELSSRKLVQALEADKIEIRRATGSYSKDDANHFAVMDDCGFRYELNHPETQAIANFNEPRVAAELVAVFDAAFSMGKPAI